ncbi:MAG TPA: aromatic amino acid ammonia-lyase [Dongiaceae bacterium]|jgi:histidine ammonia-lyase|nr:aromatic amino acid ammonia-lyase [Dongiaceae bacterium]
MARGKTITLGRWVRIADLVAIARQGARVAIGADAQRRMRKSRAVVEGLAAGDKPIYGLNTGLGAGVDTPLTAAEMSDFQARVLVARSVGIGPRFTAAEVRALMAARLIGLTHGAAGISPALAERIAAMLNKGVHPIVPSIASIGESDLAPVSHAMLPLIGAGEAELGGKLMSGAEALRRAGIKPVPLGPKDGIALVSANAASLGVGALVLHDAAVVLQAQRAALALSLEGFRGNLDPFDPRLAEVRAAPGQVEAAAAVLKLLKGGALMKPGAARRVQDPLSFRCFPSVHGAAMAALVSATLVLEQELNSGGDNPAVLPNDGDMISTGNFDITALVLEFERLGQALAQTAILAAQRIARMQSQSLTDLPRFLSPRGAMHAGLAGLMKVSSALESDIRHLAHPCSLLVMPSGDGVEDYATMAPRVVAKMRAIVDKLAAIAGMELMVAAQAVDLREVAKLGAGTQRAYDWVRGLSKMVDGDRSLGAEIEAVGAGVLRGELAKAFT